ncbi:DNA/RNA helicase domain-containing protein [Aeromicrobium sp. HA]|uniref:DNA/RNA helicase domain-containing protein n=1 Tax=Aeromicrobium sp. HA TaxID=3009077 RepID=UPI0022AFEAFE|nr:DNA/RNA helicase domain-containing protein [Aeromicrobium sp. HA]
MTGFTIRRDRFARDAVARWAKMEVAHDDWPVVYAIRGSNHVYIGESVNAATRMRQHLDSPKAPLLDRFHVVLDETFNKSVCLDLETYLIRLFGADQRFRVLNKQTNSRNSNYYDRARYRERFAEIFRALRDEGLFNARRLEDLENSNLFKLSPFVSLTQTQTVAVEKILSIVQLETPARDSRPIVVQGDPGTGKTVVGVFLAKLLVDLHDAYDPALDEETFAEESSALAARAVKNLRIGFVVPQQALRNTLKKVFEAIPALNSVPVITAFEAAEDEAGFDVLIVDEAHRLQQFSGALQTNSTRFRRINRSLFPDDHEGTRHTQLDWVRAKSRHPILLLDAKQSVRPMSDLPTAVVAGLTDEARADDRLITLGTQMRSLAGDDYVDYVVDVLTLRQERRVEFIDYDLRFYDDIRRMRQDIFKRDGEVGLSRMLAGFAWPWVSKKHKQTPDITIDGLSMFWNRTDKDWINSPTAIEEVGCIHTSQGYDLNYAGVIIGPELRWDEAKQKIVFVRENYHDKNGSKNNVALGQSYDDEDLLEYVVNVYRVLLTRGIRGTYVYVCDPTLRERLRRFFPPPPHLPLDE